MIVHLLFLVIILFKSLKFNMSFEADTTESLNVLYAHADAMRKELMGLGFCHEEAALLALKRIVDFNPSCQEMRDMLENMTYVFELQQKEFKLKFDQNKPSSDDPEAPEAELRQYTDAVELVDKLTEEN